MNITAGIEFRKREFNVLVVTSIPIFLATQTIEPIFPIFVAQKGATGLELGAIVGLLSFITIVARIPLEVLAEKIGGWRIIQIAALGQAISLIFYSVTPNYTWFYPLRTFHALVLAAFVPTAMAMVRDLSPSDKKGETTGRFLASIGIALMLGPFLCSFIIYFVNYTQLLQLTAIIPILGLIPLLLIRHKGHNFHSSDRRKTSLLSSLKKTISSRNIMVLTYLQFSFAFAFAFLITLFPIHGNNFLFSSGIALLFGIRGVANLVCRIPSGKLIDKIGYKWPIGSAVASLAVAYFLISETQNIYLLVLAMIFHGLGHGMRAVTEWTALGNSIPDDAYKIASAYILTIFEAGSAIGAVTAGALSMFLEIPTIFRLTSVIAFAALFGVPLIQKK